MNTKVTLHIAELPRSAVTHPDNNLVSLILYVLIASYKTLVQGLPNFWPLFGLHIFLH